MQNHRIIQQLNLEHSLRAHLVQPPQSGVTHETLTVNYCPALQEDTAAEQKLEEGGKWLTTTRQWPY